MLRTLKQVLVMVGAMVVLSGCYTMLNHPGIPIDFYQNETETGVNDYSQETSRCSDCHNQYHTEYPFYERGHQYSGIYDYDPFYSGPYNPYWNTGPYYSGNVYDRYYGYYSTPWWLQKQSTGSSATEESTESKPTQNSEWRDRRGGFGGSSSSQPYYGTTPIQRRRSQSSTDDSAGKQSPDESQDKSDEDSNKEKRDRRGGMR